MKLIYLVFLILFFTACGIDKESGVASDPSTNNSGELDINFNGKGFLTFDSSAGGNSNDDILDMAVDSNDRIIAVGSSVNGLSNQDLAVWRLTSNGSLDTSFSGDGVFTLDSIAGGASTDVAYGVAIDSSNEIYITGTSFNGADFDMFVIKLNENGTLDTSFNGTGILTHDDAAAGTGNHDQGNSIHIDASGNIFVTGFSDFSPTDRNMAVWKMSATGVFDNTFDTDGIFTHDIDGSGEDDIGNDIITDPAGNVYIAGRSDTGATLGDMAVWRLTSAGALDTSFDADGYFTQNSAAGGGGFDSATSLTIDSNGVLWITGYSRNISGNNDMVLWKMQSTGNLDTTYDGDGYLVFDVSTVEGSGTNDTGESIIIDSQGRIVVSGSGNENMCIWRFTSAGALDTNFNTDGFFSHDSAAGGFGIDSGPAVVEDSFNRLYIGGFSENDDGDFDAAFWRIK